MIGSNRSKNMKKIVFGIILILSCDSTLKPPNFPPPIDSILEISSELVDAFSIRINWKYDLNKENLEQFNLYAFNSQELINKNEISSFNLLTKIPLDDIQLDIDGDNYYIQDSLIYNRWYFFRLSAVIDGYESLEDSISDGIRFILEEPQYQILNDCDGFDPDCININILPFNYGVSSEIQLAEKLIKNGILDTILFYQNILDTINIKHGLSLCDIEGESDLPLFWEQKYCDVLPNIEYLVSYYYLQEKNGEIRESEYIFPFGQSVYFDREYELFDFKTLSSTDMRFYFERSIIDEGFYHTLAVYDSYTSNLIKELNFDLYSNYIFHDNIIVDIENISEFDSIGLFAYGNYSFVNLNDKIPVSTLPEIFKGFRLIEQDFPITPFESVVYVSKYELTSLEDYINDYPEFGEIPLEVSYCETENIIDNLNLLYSGTYTFRLPTEEEWEYICEWNYLVNDSTDFPWGDYEDYYCANYLNSYCPLDINNENGLCGVGFHEFNFPEFCSNVQGMSDLSGNVNEWIYSGDCISDGFASAKGGSYYDQPSLLKCNNIFLDLPMDYTTGMGLRLVMEVLN